MYCNGFFRSSAANWVEDRTGHQSCTSARARTHLRELQNKGLGVFKLDVSDQLESGHGRLCWELREDEVGDVGMGFGEMWSIYAVTGY